MRQKWLSSGNGFYMEDSDFLSFDEMIEMMSTDEICQYLTPKHCFFSYVSRKYDTIDEDLVQQREFVLRFKAGNGIDVAHAASITAQYLMQSGLQEEYTFLCLPASTPSKHKKRFSRFMQKVAKLTGIQNGYDLIEVKRRRGEVHAGAARSVKNYTISSSVKGKKIVLFDDVHTTGKSFASFACELEKLGAEVVHGVFLAEAETPWNI